MGWGMAVDPGRFVEVLRLGALQAGAVARHLRGKVPRESKDAPGSAEAEALTAVDLATQDVLLHLLRDTMPEVALDTEEDTEAVRLFPPYDPARSLVVLDPVDGTLNYTLGSDEYAVMGALLEYGLFRAAVIYFPEHRTMCWAVRGEGCFVERDGRGAERVGVDRARDTILVTPGVDEAARAALAARAGDVEVSHCSAVDASAPAIGRAKASVSEGRADRRRAIGLFLTLEAGGCVLFGDRPWSGEDPELLPLDASPTIAAANAELARAVRLAVS